MCHGSNIVSVYQCPRSLAGSLKAAVLLPFFQRYLEYGEFPDGKGMVYQPVPLIEAMEIFVKYFRKYEKNDSEKKLRDIKIGKQP